MKKLLGAACALLITLAATAQNANPWTSRANAEGLSVAKGARRASFPKSFKLFSLDAATLRAQLFEVVGNTQRHSTVISLPNADGAIEQFEINEASNFEPALQARFPEIRAFSGRGISNAMPLSNSVTRPRACRRWCSAPAAARSLWKLTRKASRYMPFTAGSPQPAPTGAALHRRTAWRMR